MLAAAGYGLALAMGVTLGLIGAGGSILTVPILVYLLGVTPVVATGYSLLVVGSAALMGALRYQRHGQVNLRAALIFTIPAMLAVLFARSYIVPALPDPMLTLGALPLPKDAFIMGLFACLMLMAAGFMLKPVRVEPTRSASAMTPSRAIALVGGSAGVGLLTGMVGAGGGFLIIPTLIALFGLKVKEAIGTSLAVIAMNSLVGFKGDLAAGIPMNWNLLGLFLSLTLAGMWIGTSAGKRADGARLKALFGWFTLLVGIAVLARELFVLFTH